jgi:hypothetical protein
MCHENLLLAELLRAVDSSGKGDVSYWSALKMAFRNRNDSRILMQNLDRFDYLWHLSTQYSWARTFDLFSEFPFLGGLSFAGTENFPSSRDHALNAILRPFFEGSWFTRTIAGGVQANVAIDHKAPAQNLAEQSNGFEAANRNQYGTRFGRDRVNKFRLEHRLPADESVVRVFMASPAVAMVNNGCEHVLNCVANHWNNMLYQENGNFGHQRQELLNPFEILRFHMPLVLATLANLRGRNSWDVKILGPFMKKLQNLNPDRIRVRSSGADVEQAIDQSADEILAPCLQVIKLVDKMVERPKNSNGEYERSIVDMVCAGIPARVEPFERWLKAIRRSCGVDFLQAEAATVQTYLSSVDLGIQIGSGLLRIVNFTVPSDWRLRNAIMNYLKGKEVDGGISRDAVLRALQHLTPRDLGTFKGLVKEGLESTEPAKLLLGRVTTLLKRELRRDALDKKIIDMSKGKEANVHALTKNKWYWMRQGGQGPWRKMLFLRRSTDLKKLKLLDVTTSVNELWSPNDVTCVEYVPVGEAISRAQKASMDIELDCVKRFSLETYMEFGSAANPRSTRSRLVCLSLVAQIHCPEVDIAALNVLSEVKSSANKIKASIYGAQNVIVLGGGPTGLLAAIHCLHNVLLSRGSLKGMDASIDLFIVFTVITAKKKSHFCIFLLFGCRLLLSLSIRETGCH